MVFATEAVTVEVVSSAGEPVEGARVQWYGGQWREAGATGVDGTVVFETWDQTIPVQVWLDGRVKRIDQNVAVDPIVEFATTEVTVEVASAAGEPVEGARVQWYGGQWREAGATGVDGTVVFETWDQTIPVQVWLDGRVKRIDQNVAWDGRVVFATEAVTVEVVSSAGEPVEGARVQWYGGQWREAGATGVDGTVVFETWDQTIPVQVWLDGRVKRIDQNVAWDGRVVFATEAVTVEVVSSAGEPVEGARVQWYGGQWREAGATGVDGTVVFETWDQTIPVQVWLDGRVKRIDQNIAVDPIVEFATTEVTVEVVSSNGDPIPGAAVAWYGGSWQQAGRTPDNGLVVFETWDQTIPVTVTVNGRSQRKDQNTARLSATIASRRCRCPPTSPRTPSSTTMVSGAATTTVTSSSPVRCPCAVPMPRLTGSPSPSPNRRPRPNPSRRHARTQPRAHLRAGVDPGAHPGPRDRDRDRDRRRCRDSPDRLRPSTDRLRSRRRPTRPRRHSPSRTPRTTDHRWSSIFPGTSRAPLSLPGATLRRPASRRRSTRHPPTLRRPRRLSRNRLPHLRPLAQRTSLRRAPKTSTAWSSSFGPPRHRPTLRPTMPSPSISR